MQKPSRIMQKTRYLHGYLVFFLNIDVNLYALSMHRNIRKKGNKKPHGKKEVKPWGNKRRLRLTSHMP